MLPKQGWNSTQEDGVLLLVSLCASLALDGSLHFDT